MAATWQRPIDEAMIPFKGRFSMKQYILPKPVKRGIKVWECADPSYGFVCNTSVYTGRQRDGNPEQGLRYRVVHNLTRTLLDKNHHVFLNIFFNLVALPKACYENWTDLHLWDCSVKSPRHSKGNWAPRTKSEMSLSGRIFVSVWKDKKPVYFLSTQGDEKDTRKQWDGTNIEEPSVPVVNSYNTNMSGMDLSDQIWGSY